MFVRYQGITLSCSFCPVQSSKFNASNRFQRAKIASPEFIGSMECFIGKMHLLGLELFKFRVSRKFSACVEEHPCMETYSSDEYNEWSGRWRRRWTFQSSQCDKTYVRRLFILGSKTNFPYFPSIHSEPPF
jgi:hypothetical protein